MLTYTCIDLKEYIYPQVNAEDSIILRYCKSFQPAIDLGLLKSTSIREGCRILGPIGCNGTNIFILDMASLMADGNFKSSVACISIARSIEQGARELVVCSSGNTGTSVARYSKHKRLKAHIFIPKMSSYKFDFSVIDEKLHHVKIIDKPEWEVHAYAQAFARENRFPLVPSTEYQLESNSCRAMFVLEYMQENDIAFDWTSQAISGGHGPVGFYKKLYSLVNDGLQVSKVPGFIGVQQAGICPMYNAWISSRDYLTQDDINLYPQNVIEPTLYSTRPESNYRYLYKVLKENGGIFYCIDLPEYNRLEDQMLKIIRNCGLKLKSRKINNEEVITEKAGILSGMGILKAIEDGVIQPGENVLLTFTGTTGV